MLVGFPIALYTSGLISLITYAVIGDLFWYRAAMTMWFVGVAFALHSAIFGAVDLFVGVPRAERSTRKDGYIHAGLNVLAVVLFAGAAFSLYDSWRHPWEGFSFTLPLVMGAIGLVVTGAAGALGWKLVQTHHVGIEDTGITATESEPDRTLQARPLG
jgi:uncharacterized membrane protein